MVFEIDKLLEKCRFEWHQSCGEIKFLCRARKRNGNGGSQELVRQKSSLSKSTKLLKTGISCVSVIMNLTQ